MNRLKRKVRIKYEHVSNKETQQKLDEVFDWIFEKIAEVNLKREALDKNEIMSYDDIYLVNNKYL